MEIQNNKRSEHREKLQVIARSSKNWEEQNILSSLKKWVYPTKKEILTFSEFFLIGIGTVLFLAGIIFFFAYNWEYLSKFQKLGLVQLGLLSIGIGSLFINKRTFSLQICLTVLSVLTGVLFAVFGQIYQTGANVYDLFLVWCFAITIWVVISNFPPLWYFFFVLIQTTTILYKFQVARYNANFSSELIVAVFGIVFFIAWVFLSKKTDKFKNHNWFEKALLIQVFFSLTSLISRGFWSKRLSEMYPIAILVYLVFCGALFFYSYKEKNLFNITLFALSICGIIYSFLTRFLTKGHDYIGNFFLLSFLIIGISSGVFYGLIQLHKKWNRYA